ncbi:MAG: alpha/beta hydrolase [Pseudomonadota bacterium]|nr:alpha/beta hydrolase [Pseudomonadota bacterium]
MIDANLVYFAHGKESGPWGTKITRLAAVARRSGYRVASPDYSHTHDPKTRVAQLLDIHPKTNGALVLVGSSMGGYVSAAASHRLKPDGLFLMAPALYFQGFELPAPASARLMAVVHGWQDEIVPVDAGIRFAREHSASLHVLKSGHTLTDQLPILEYLFADFLAQVSTRVLSERSRENGEPKNPISPA